VKDRLPATRIRWLLAAVQIRKPVGSDRPKAELRVRRWVVRKQPPPMAGRYAATAARRGLPSHPKSL